MDELNQLSKEEKDQRFLAACFEGELELVKILTSGKDFPCVDIFCADNNAPVYKESVCLDYAVEARSLPIIKHLINLPQGKRLLMEGGRNAFRSAFHSKQMNIVQYFIFEADISESICDLYYGKEKIELKSYFAAKELYSKLDNQLENTPVNKKRKI